MRGWDAPSRTKLITTLSDLDFEPAYAARAEQEAGGVRVSWIGLEDLRRSKRATGRRQNPAGLENIGRPHSRQPCPATFSLRA